MSLYGNHDVENNHYIINYIKTSQVQYENISRRPSDVLSHLLFVNGNGCEIRDGVFVQYFKFGNSVPYSEFYKTTRTIKQMIEYENDRGFDREIENFTHKATHEFAMKVAKGVISDFPSEDTFHSRAVELFYERFDKTDFVTNYSIEDLQNSEVLYQMLLKSKYQPYLQLSKGYFKADFFNENTDVDMLKVARALAEAYIKLFSELLENPKAHSFKRELSKLDEQQSKIMERDVELLTDLVQRIDVLIQKSPEFFAE